MIQNMKQFFSALLLLGVTTVSQAQILITDPDFDQNNPINCANFDDGSVQNFYDSGNSGANYGDNENQVITICPDLANLVGSKISITFATNVGFTWDVLAGDFVTVYDGPTTASPLLGTHNSVTDPNGFTYTASFNNPSGCLTIQFTSDGAGNGTGWGANVSCGNPIQPYDPHIEAYVNGNQPDALNPSDTGYVDVCFGDSILFTALPVFPYSSASNQANYGIPFGYNQTIANSSFEWDFSDGTSQTGQSVWFTPPNRAGYLVTLRTTDTLNNITVMRCKVRVSTIPSFAGTMPLDDTICLGTTTLLIGGVTNTDTVGVDPTQGSFEVGGVFAGLTYLPDGSGQNYQTTVNISDFAPGQTITAASDIQRMCVTMEHSYLGDLEMGLTCPNGTTINIFNSYGPGGLFAGGFNGGGTFLGEADDSGNGTPGVGYEYCFDENAAWGTLGQEFAAGNTVGLTAPPSPSTGNTMSPGTYQPEVSFASFIGCPINGPWTITIRDNLGIDDGYIFEWGIFFNPAINPNTEFYTPLISTENWLSSPDIISGQSDTAVIVQPTTTGNHFYTYQVTDNFGCTYDTTIRVHVLGLPTLPSSNETCDLFYNISGVTAPGAVNWAVVSQPSGSNISFSNASALNPTITVNTPGVYQVSITDLECSNSDTITIAYLEDPAPNLQNDSICLDELIVLNASSPNATYLWNTGDTTASIVPISTTEGWVSYIVAVTNICATVTDTSQVYYEDCNIIIPNVFSPTNVDGNNDVFEIVGIENNPNTRLEVYDRWGTLVYENDNYQNNWDGKHVKNGKPVSDGTYFYVIHVTRKDKHYSGTVTILSKQ